MSAPQRGPCAEQDSDVGTPKTTPSRSRGGASHDHATPPHTPLASASSTQAPRSRGLLLSHVQGCGGSAWAPRWDGPHGLDSQAGPALRSTRDPV